VVSAGIIADNSLSSETGFIFETAFTFFLTVFLFF
jgi:hypothetical protein